MIACQAVRLPNRLWQAVLRGAAQHDVDGRHHVNSVAGGYEDRLYPAPCPKTSADHRPLPVPEIFKRTL